MKYETGKTLDIREEISPEVLFKAHIERVDMRLREYDDDPYGYMAQARDMYASIIGRSSSAYWRRDEARKATADFALEQGDPFLLQECFDTMEDAQARLQLAADAICAGYLTVDEYYDQREVVFNKADENEDYYALAQAATTDLQVQLFEKAEDRIPSTCQKIVELAATHEQCRNANEYNRRPNTLLLEAVEKLSEYEHYREAEQLIAYMSDSIKEPEHSTEYVPNSIKIARVDVRCAESLLLWYRAKANDIKLPERVKLQRTAKLSRDIAARRTARVGLLLAHEKDASADRDDHDFGPRTAKFVSRHLPQFYAAKQTFLGHPYAYHSTALTADKRAPCDLRALLATDINAARKAYHTFAVSRQSEGAHTGNDVSQLKCALLMHQNDQLLDGGNAMAHEATRAAIQTGLVSTVLRRELLADSLNLRQESTELITEGLEATRNLPFSRVRVEAVIELAKKQQESHPRHKALAKEVQRELIFIAAYLGSTPQLEVEPDIIQHLTEAGVVKPKKVDPDGVGYNFSKNDTILHQLLLSGKLDNHS